MASKSPAATERSMQPPFVFEYCPDLHTVPEEALPLERELHGGFAVDRRSNQGYIYYGIADCGLVRIILYLTGQEVREIPPDLSNVNFGGSPFLKV